MTALLSLAKREVPVLIVNQSQSSAGNETGTEVVVTLQNALSQQKVPHSLTGIEGTSQPSAQVTSIGVPQLPENPLLDVERLAIRFVKLRHKTLYFQII